MSKRISCMAGICLLVLAASGQPVLKEGSVLPEGLRLLLEKNMGAPGSEKIIILEFWSTGCLSCIKSFSRLDSLQSKYRGKVRFVLITEESSQKVDQLFARKAIKRPGVQFMNEDKRFSKAFPHLGVPHVVIIVNNTVSNITYGHNINDATLQSLISGERPRLRNKEDDNFNSRQPLWMEGEGRLVKDLLSYSLFMRRIKERSGSGTSYFVDSNKCGYRFINMPVLSLFQIAYSQGLNTGFWNKERIRFSDEDLKALLTPEDPSQLDAWLDSFAYCYEICVPVSEKSFIFMNMQKDLEQYFPFRAEVVKKKTACLALICRATDDNIHKSEKQIRRKSLHPVTVDALVDSLNSIYHGLLPPFVNATWSMGNIELAAKDLPPDLLQLRENLRKQDMDLILTEMETSELFIQKRI